MTLLSEGETVEKVNMVNKMPHLIIDYSANLEARVDIPGLCDLLRRKAGRLEIFPAAGVRVRAIPAPHWSIADGDPEHGYIDVSVRLRAGRPQVAKEAATAELFEAAKDYLSAALAEGSLALSFEMRDIDAALSPKISSTREHLPEEFT
ncbi:MAG: 5-carboxymethyl-2-hydroxymuconate isomerase [Pseudomonadota bacterium]